jgi:hypothetical protein
MRLQYYKLPLNFSETRSVSNLEMSDGQQYICIVITQKVVYFTHVRH